MSSRVFTLFCAVLISTLIAGSLNLVAGQEADSLFELVGTHAPPEMSEHHFVAVMGEVERPGTYRLPQSSLTMHTLVRCAQGFRDDASMAIRVIRRGRFSQIEIFSDKADSRLWPGDLLIVESKRPSAVSNKETDFDGNRSDVTRADYYASDRSAVVQIALVNLMEYPVVLRLRPEQANASGLLKSLDQPLTLLNETHVITPDVPYRQSSDAAKKAARMQNCSVMVFEPDEVRRRQILGRLPLPINTAQTVASGTDLDPFAQTGRRTFRQTAQSSFDDRFDTISGGRASQSDVILIPCDQFSPDFRSSQEPESAVFGQFTPAFATKPAESSMHDATPLMPASEELSEDASQSSLPIAEGLTEGEEMESPQPEHSFLHLLVIVLAVGTLVCAALLLRHSLESRTLKEQKATDLSELFPERSFSQGTRIGRITDPTIPPRLLSDQPPASDELNDFPKVRNFEPVIVGAAETPRDILQMQTTKATAPLAAAQSTRKSASQPAVHDPAGELSSIPFRAPEAIKLKLRLSDDPAPTTSPTSDPKSVPESQIHPTPVAKALFQLENKRQA